MGLSSSKTKTKTESTPYAAATPLINSALADSNTLYQQQQPRLEQLSQTAQDAFSNIAPDAFGTSDYVRSAQAAAQNIFSRSSAATPGSTTYAGLQAWSNPASGTLAALANGSTSPGNYSSIGASNPGLDAIQKTATGNNPALGILSGLAQGGVNPATGDLSDIASSGGANSAIAGLSAMGYGASNRPSASVYADLTDPNSSNPYLDAIVSKSNDAATRAVNARFAASGLGAGISTPYAETLSRTLADSENTLRYGAYNDTQNRRLAAAGQSDAAYSTDQASRLSALSQLSNANQQQTANRLSAAGTLGSQYLTDQSARASAAGTLGSLYNTQRSTDLDAANSLGALYNSTGALRLQGQQAADQAFQSDRSAQLAAAQAYGNAASGEADTRLRAAQASDTSQNSQIAQALQALGLTGSLTDAQYAGINPSLNLLNTAAQIPYTGLNAQAGLLNTLAGRYGTSTGTTTGNPSLLSSIGSAIQIGSDAKSLFSDKRLKENIIKIGEMHDGLGLYEYNYIWSPVKTVGVMADEVANLRPWAMAAPVNGFSRVNYEAL